MILVTIFSTHSVTVVLAYCEIFKNIDMISTIYELKNLLVFTNVHNVINILNCACILLCKYITMYAVSKIYDRLPENL
jgi:hypothetical protein